MHEIFVMSICYIIDVYVVCFWSLASHDYVSGEYTVEVPAGERIAYLMVETIDDGIAELTEFFTARITQTCEASIISEQQNTSYVTILDNDSKCTVFHEVSIAVAMACTGCSNKFLFLYNLFLIDH